MGRDPAANGHCQSSKKIKEVNATKPGVQTYEVRTATGIRIRCLTPAETNNHGKVPKALHTSTYEFLPVTLRETPILKIEDPLVQTLLQALEKNKIRNNKE